MKENDKNFKVLNLKYAISTGVTVLTVVQGGSTNSVWDRGHMHLYGRDKEWSTDKDSAKSRVNQMFVNKRKSLEKSLAKLETRRLQAIADIDEAEL